MHTSSTTETPSREYRAWNDAFAAEFFSGKYGGRPVYIDLEDEVFRRVAESIGVAPGRDAEAEFIAAVDGTLRIDDWGGIFRDHAEALLHFKLFEDGTWPPQVGLLGFQSLVAERMRSEGDLRASNYYGRFLEILGRDPADGNLRQKLANAFSNESDALWAELNGWLREKPEVRGLPTAFAFDSRVHIGLPMSQALVRESDRAVLHQMFDDLDLDAGQTIAGDDMERLLRSYIPTSHAGKSFKKLCADNSAAPRIAEVACLELASWTPALDSQSALVGVRVGLSLAKKGLPRPSIHLGLIVKSQAADHARIAFGAIDDSDDRGDEVPLSSADESGWRRVDARIPSDAMLNSTIGVQVPGTASGARTPRRLVLFQQQTDGPLLLEVARVRLGAEHTILVAESLREKLEQELAKIARPGFLWSDSRAGIPDGWSMVERVEIIAITETKLLDLGALIPRAWTDLTIEGGLRIPGRVRRWHSGFPPEIQAISATGQEATLQIRAARDSGDERDTVHLAEDFDDLAILDASILRGEDCEVEVEVVERSSAASVLNRSSFSLVSASSCAPSTIAGSKMSYSPMADGRGVISASESESTVEVRGAFVIGSDANEDFGDEFLQARAFASVTSQLEDLPVEADEVETDGSGVILRPSLTDASTPECFRTGGHYFLLPDAAPRRGRPAKKDVEGRCKLCGMTKEFPLRPNSTRRTRDVHDRLSAPSRIAAPSVTANSELDVDGNSLFDALCVLQTGTQSALSTLASSASSEPWFAKEWARSLVALGHLDVAYDEKLKLSTWQVSPASVVRGSEDWFLAGWRSQQFLEVVIGLANEWGFESQIDSQGRAPDRVALVAIEDGADIDGLVEAVSEQSGVELSLMTEVGPELLSVLPHLPSIRSALPTVAAIPGRSKLSRFSVARMSWDPIDRPERPGFYRLERFGFEYIHSDGRDLRVVTNRLGKWLAAWDESQRIFAYDAENREIRCHRFSEPPGLFERALTLCSGRLDVSPRVVNYSGVSPEVASLFASRNLRSEVESATA